MVNIVNHFACSIGLLSLGTCSYPLSIYFSLSQNEIAFLVWVPDWLAAVDELLHKIVVNKEQKTGVTMKEVIMGYNSQSPTWSCSFTVFQLLSVRCPSILHLAAVCCGECWRNLVPCLDSLLFYLWTREITPNKHLGFCCNVWFFNTLFFVTKRPYYDLPGSSIAKAICSCHGHVNLEAKSRKSELQFV